MYINSNKQKKSFIVFQFVITIGMDLIIINYHDGGAVVTEGDGESLHFGLADFPKKDVMEICLRFNDMLIEKIFTSLGDPVTQKSNHQPKKP